MDPRVSQSAEVLIDTAVSFDPNADEGSNLGAAQVALWPLSAAAGITVQIDGETAQVDASGLVGAAQICIQWLAQEFADAAGVDRLDVLADLREYVRSMDETWRS